MNAGGAHMAEGEQRLKEYVQRAIRGTPFEIETDPVTEQTSPDGLAGFGTTAFHIYATDEAIALLGVAGASALSLMDARENLPQRLSAATVHVYVLIETNANGQLRVAKSRIR